MVQKQRRYDCAAGCPVEAALDLIDGKWKGVILYHLGAGTLRFNELVRRLNDITPRMLTKQLRELEADGLITRTVFPQVPPRVDYALTAEGVSMAPIIEALRQWGEARLAAKAAVATPDADAQADAA